MKKIICLFIINIIFQFYFFIVGLINPFIIGKFGENGYYSCEKNTRIERLAFFKQLGCYLQEIEK
jgi:hypothetical protein